MKKLTSLLLSVVIVLTLLPFDALTAFADDEQLQTFSQEESSPEAQADISWKRTKEYNWWGTPQSVQFSNDNDVLRWKWDQVNWRLQNWGNTVWDDGYYADLHSHVIPSYATWSNEHGRHKEATLRRFQGSFTIPEGFSARDTVMISSVNQSYYSGFNGGNILPINDNIYIFVYKKDDVDTINNRNFMDYLAFWTGTSNQSGIVNFNGVPGTEAHQYNSGNLRRTHPLYHVDGWYCNATLDNIGNSLFKNYRQAEAGDEFIIDVFAADYRNYGGMDELEITFKKATDRRAIVNYYKEDVSKENLIGSYVMKNLYEGQEVALKQGVKEGELNYYKHNLSSAVYKNGEQRPEVAIIGQEEETVINVVYPLKRDQPYKIEHYLENTDGETYRVVEEQGTARVGTTVTANVMEDLPYHTFNQNHPNNVVEGTVDRGNLVLKLYYDRDEYTLTYNANGGKGEIYVTKDLLAESEVTVAGSEHIHRTGYRFLSWNTKKDGTGERYVKGSNFKLLQDTHLFAQWEKNSSQWFTVHYDANTGTGTVPQDQNSYVIGTQAKVLGKGDLSKEYYTFTGWNTNANGSGTSYQEQDSTSELTSNMTLYAQWQENQKFVLSYNANGGEGEVPAENQLYEGQSHQLENATLTKAGFRFNGWIYTTQTGARVLKPGESITMPANNVVLKASWVRDEHQKHQVSYNGNHGVGDVPQTQEFYHGDQYTVQNTDITKAGYKLDGWKSNIEIDGKTMFGPDENFTMPNSDVVLTAKWARDDDQKHHITYNSNEGIGDVPQTLELYHGDRYTVQSADITKVGYKLDGWTTDVAIDGKTSFNPQDTFTMPNGNVELTANWVRDDDQKHNITYNSANGVGDIPQRQELYHGDTYTVQNADIIKAGYKLSGWTTNVAIDGKTSFNPEDTFTMPNSNVVLTANWVRDVAQQHSVTYAINGGSGQLPQGEELYYGDTCTVQNADIIKVGYKLAGWTSDVAIGGKTSFNPEETFTMPNINVVLTANWVRDNNQRHQVSYNINNGIGDVPQTENKYYGDEYTVKDSEITRLGYNFMGWEYTIDGSTKTLSANDTFIMPNADVELTAKWQINTTQWHKVTYNANGGVGEVPVDETSYVTGSDVPVKDHGALELENYQFTGWNTKANGTGDAYNANGEIISIQESKILYAQWEKDPEKWNRLTYDLQGGEPQIAEEEHFVGEIFNLSSILPTKENYIFDGWNVDGTEESYQRGHSFTMGEQDVTLVAQWAKDPQHWHTVTYEANGANEEVPKDDNTYLADTTVNVSDQQMTKRGYTFAGWKYGEELLTSKTFTMPNENVTLVAQWAIDEGQWYSVTYNTNGGEQENFVDSEKYYQSKEVTVTNQAVTKPGYTFDGWKRKEDILQAGDHFDMPNGNVELVAQWKFDENQWYGVLYDTAGGVEDAPEDDTTYLAGSTVKVSSEQITKLGYKFGGWMLDNEVLKDTFTMPNHQVTLVANWIYDEDQWYSVTYDTNGGEQENFEDSEKYYQSKEVTVTDETITKPGYTFDGWKLKEDTLQAGDHFTMPNGDAELVAMWTEDPEQWHSVRYIAEDANEEPPVDSEKHYVTEEVEVSTDVMSKEGYNFLGWLYKGEHYGSVEGNKEALIMPNSDVELVADFEKTTGMWFTVNYNANLPEGTVLAGGTVPVDEEEYLSKAAVPVKGNENAMSVLGYTFKGWMLQPDAEELVGETVTITDYTTLYAKWEKADGEWFKVTYEANGGKNAPEGGEYLVGTDVAIASASEMSKRGFTFGGWVSDQIFNGEVITEESFEMPKEPVTLKAQWDEIVGEISVTHKYFTNNELDGEVTDESTEIGYEFSIINLIKDLFNSLKYNVELSNVVVERRRIVPEEVEPEEMIEVPPIEEVTGIAPSGGAQEQPATPEDGETGTEPTTPEDGETGTKPTTPEDGETGTKPTTPEDGETGTEPTTPEDGETGTKPTTPEDGETGTEPTTPEDGETGTKPTTPEDGETGAEPNTPEDGETGTEPTTPEDDKTEPNSSESDSDTSTQSQDSSTGSDADTSESSDSEPASESDSSSSSEDSSTDSNSDTSKSSESEPDSHSDSSSDSVDTSVLAATSEDDVETILAKEEEIKAAEQEVREEAKAADVPDEAQNEELESEDVPAEEIEQDSNEEEEEIEAEWEEVEEEDGKYIFEEGYEYRVTINYYRTTSSGGGSHNNHHHHHSSNSDRTDSKGENQQPTVTIPDAEVPLAKPDQITIIDEQVPLGKLPQTGGNSAVIATSSGLLALLLAAVKKFISKQEEE